MYRRLIEAIGWFFFDLLILGYVEDRNTGLSFRLPGGLDWVIYVEVPSRDLTLTSEEMLEQFCGDIPMLSLLGSACKVLNEIPFIIDEEVQLVCKYLKAHKEGRINQLYKEGMFLSAHLSIRPVYCHILLHRESAKLISIQIKISIRVIAEWIRGNGN